MAAGKQKSKKPRAPRKPLPTDAGARVRLAQPAQPQGGREIISMPEAIATLKTTQPTFYRWLRTGRISGMKVGRQWRFYREDIERFLKGGAPRIVLPADIAPLTRALEERLREAGGKAVPAGEADEIDRVVRLMISLGVAIGAEDLHITTHIGTGALATERGSSQTASILRCRIDGVLHELAAFDTRLLPLVIERWKGMAGCDVREKVRPQDGRIITDVVRREGEPARRIDMRVSFLPSVLGESATVRILDAVGVSLDLDAIDFAPRDRERLLAATRARGRALIVTGPTGCGKTTTIYSCLNKIDGRREKVMTVEDPVEFVLPWAAQTAVNEAEGMTIERAIRGMLRSDANVIFVGEIRNFDILNLVAQASLTGHLVISTLHANDAVAALKRMVDIGLAPFVVADAVGIVESQRLVRKLCPKCSVPDSPREAELDWAASAARRGGLDWDALQRAFRKPVGCPDCARTGFKGRTIIVETLPVSHEIRAALVAGASSDELLSIAVGQGMTTMAADGVRRAAAGQTTIEEVRRVIA